jgi:NAD(P)-dependent dehydrogenase (short-subunit alcohol dehydrogenase family)
MGRPKDKVAAITAGTSGMALATAKLFVEEGDYVFMTGRRQDALDRAVAAIGRSVTGVQGDASHLADLDRCFARTVNTESGKPFTSPIEPFRMIEPPSIARTWLVDLKDRKIA